MGVGVSCIKYQRCNVRLWIKECGMRMQDVNEWDNLRYMCSKWMGSKTNEELELVQCKAKGLNFGQLQHDRPDDSPTKLWTTGDVECSVLSQEEQHIIFVIISFFLNHLPIYLHQMLPPSWAWLCCLSYTQINHISIEKMSLVPLVPSLWYTWNPCINYTEEPYQHTSTEDEGTGSNVHQPWWAQVAQSYCLWLLLLSEWITGNLS